MPTSRTRSSRLAPFALATAALFALLLIGCKPGNNAQQERAEVPPGKPSESIKNDKGAKGETGKKGDTDTKGDKPEKGTPVEVGVPVAPGTGGVSAPKVAPGDGPKEEPKVEPKVEPKTVVPAAPAGGPPRRIALLVGIAKYDSEVGDLLYPENDVTALAEVLSGRGYKADDVVVMSTTAGQRDKTLLPTAANIKARLDALLTGVRKDDLVLIAFAGHGIQPEGDKAYFCAYQTKLADTKTMVAIDDVIAALNKSAATTKILLVDACRDTPGARAPKPRELSVVDIPTVTGRDGTATIAYFSCDKGEKSWEVDELKHGVFFYQIIAGLKGEADTYPDGYITWNEMVDYVQRNVNFHNSKFEAKKQTPHFRGEVRNAAPVVVLPGAGKADLARPAAGGATTDDAANEDFRRVASGSLPRGWDGVAFVRTYDEKASRPCVELRRKEGSHALAIPLAKPLAGNFAVEIEFRLAGLTSAYYQQQQLALWLEGEGGQIIPVVIDHDGKVHFVDTAPKGTEKFAKNEINRLKLVRSGDSYALFLNDGDAASTRINYTGQINGLYLMGSHVWHGDPARAPDLITRLYSVKAGSVKAGDATKVGRTALYENFHARERGAILPNGWLGDAYSVATDERYDLRALEVNKTESQIYWVVVPKQEETLGKGRGFAIDLDVRLCGYPDENAWFYADRAQGQEVYLRLEGPGTLPLTVAMDAHGRIRLSGEKEVKAKWFAHHGTNRLRLIAQNGVVQVLVNGVSVVESKRPAGNFAGLGVGLVGGVPRVSYGFSAKLYGVRLTALPGPAAPVQEFRGLAEDFLTAPLGNPPQGWNGTNIVCRAGEGRPGNRVGLPGLQLTDPEKPGAIRLGNLKLEGDFSAAIEVVHTDLIYKDIIGFGLHGSGKGQSLEVALFYQDRKYMLQSRVGGVAQPAANVTTIIDAGKPCVIGVERSGNAVAITLNGQQVSVLPVGKTTPTYEGVQINLSSTAKTSSPNVSRVFVAAK
jgi:hypothetical protein